MPERALPSALYATPAWSADLFKSPLAAIDEQKIRDRVIGDEEIHPAVVVDVGGNHSPGFAGNCRNARLLADVGEGSVAVVVKEPTGHRPVQSRNAIVRFASPCAAGPVLRFAEIHEPADEKIEPAIIVVVEPDRTGCPSRSRDASLHRDIRKSTVAIVVIQNAVAVLRDVHVGKAIAVVVADRHALPIAARRDPGFFGNVGESSVAIVAVESIAQRRIGVEEVTLAAVDQVNVHPAIVVVVKESAARAGGFGQIFLGRFSGSVGPRMPLVEGRTSSNGYAISGSAAAK